jgi:hypothetical protein
MGQLFFKCVKPVSEPYSRITWAATGYIVEDDCYAIGKHLKLAIKHRFAVDAGLPAMRCRND